MEFRSSLPDHKIGRFYSGDRVTGSHLIDELRPIADHALEDAASICCEWDKPRGSSLGTLTEYAETFVIPIYIRELETDHLNMSHSEIELAMYDGPLDRRHGMLH